MLNSSHLRLNHTKIMKWKTDDGDYQMETAITSLDSNIEYWWESVLDRMELHQRIVFLVIFCTIVGFGFVGNLMTLYVITVR